MVMAMRTTARNPISAPSTASPRELAPAASRDSSSGEAGSTQNSEVGSTWDISSLSLSSL